MLVEARHHMALSPEDSQVQCASSIIFAKQHGTVEYLSQSTTSTASLLVGSIELHLLSTLPWLSESTWVLNRAIY